MNIAVIGGGAAGFFAAIHAREHHPNAHVSLFEKSHKVLSKVRISGGGRCNVTNGCTSVDALCKAYPRGGRRLKKAFHRFNTTDTRDWFESRGVPLKTEADQRVFPVSDQSQTIIDCLTHEVRRLGIRLSTKTNVFRIQPTRNQINLTFSAGQEFTRSFDRVIVATGGTPRQKDLAWLEALGHQIEHPVPSLFTFNMPDEAITKLQGVSVKQARVQVLDTKLQAEGPLLITHWGMSGPAVLKLSSFGARTLSDMGYVFTLAVNWVDERSHDTVHAHLKEIVHTHPQRIVTSTRPYQLSRQLWSYLLEKHQLPTDRRWSEVSKKMLNKMSQFLTRDLYHVRGKTSFKEEFVTCGGISLDSVDLNTMKSKVCNNLYFAGEVLDIDAITGGYNFQAAWTTGFIAGQLGR